MKRMRLYVFVLASCLALLGAALGLTNGAQAFGPTSVTLGASLYLNPNSGFYTPYNDVITLQQSPANPNSSDVVVVTLSGAQGPRNGPIPSPPNQSVIRATLELRVNNQFSQYVFLNDNATACNYPAQAVTAYDNQGPYTISGNYVAPGTTSGLSSASLVFRQLFFDSSGDNNSRFAFNSGTLNPLCSAPQADYYISEVVNLAFPSSTNNRFSPPPSTRIIENFEIQGPQVSILGATGQLPGVQAIRGSGTYSESIEVTGSNFPAELNGFVVRFCDSLGFNCDQNLQNDLSVNSSGILSGTISKPAGVGLTTGARTLRIDSYTQYTLSPVLVLGAPTVVVTPTKVSLGTPISVSGSNFNPQQIAYVQAVTSGSEPYSPTLDSPIALGTASDTGIVSGVLTTIDPNASAILIYQGNITGSTPEDVRQSTPITINLANCLIDPAGGGNSSCETSQNINFSVTEGVLTQRTYTNANFGSTPSLCFNPTSFGLTCYGLSFYSSQGRLLNNPTPNPNPTTVSLSPVTSPTAYTELTGYLNDITVTDSRGGTNGWTLSFTLSDFVSSSGKRIPNNRLLYASKCTAATSANAWDFSQTGQQVINDYTPQNVAPISIAGGGSNQSYGTQQLCAKNTAIDPDSGTTGGVWNISTGIALLVPPFQGAGDYAATMTITLA